MLLTLADYERAATESLDLGVQAYYFGGAADEITLEDNVAAWRRLAVHPRVLVGVGQRDPGVTVLGRRRPHPTAAADCRPKHGLAAASPASPAARQAGSAQRVPAHLPPPAHRWRAQTA